MIIISEITSKIIQNNAFYVFFCLKTFIFFYFWGSTAPGLHFRVLPFYPKHVLINHFVGNKAKGRISKPVFQEIKARQIRDTPYQEVRNCFS